MNGQIILNNTMSEKGRDLTQFYDKSPTLTENLLQSFVMPKR